MIQELIVQGSISETTIGILSGCILGEAQQVSYAREVRNHMEQTVKLLTRTNDSVQTIDEQDVTVRANLTVLSFSQFEYIQIHAQCKKIFVGLCVQINGSYKY